MNLMQKREMEPYVSKTNKPIPQDNAFVSKETKILVENDEHFQKNFFFSSFTEAALHASSSSYLVHTNPDQNVKSSKTEVHATSINTMCVDKAQDVLNIMIKTQEHKAAFTTSF